MFEPYTLIKIKFIPHPSSSYHVEEDTTAYGVFKKIGYEKHKKKKNVMTMYFEVDTILPVENQWNYGEVPEYLPDAHLTLYSWDFEELPFENAPEFLKELLLSPAALTHKLSGIRVLAKRLQNVT